ncbi:hypothetical protein BpHYR1_022731 [Brachionus plicatilis]|uniref:Uncharacterized protein n=1 Tax=Brachionus plicatilis TaxID=10195 RepID=A0A3M7R4T4_BRAPC|nr:hypothetical protein BpHYR1_022731 [Brachionus plicatilis]
MEKEIKGSLKNDIPDEEMNDKVGETQILKQTKSNCPDKNCDGNEGKRECDRNGKSLEDEINKLREKSHSMEQKLIEKENNEMFKKDKAKILDLEVTIRKNKSDHENQIDLSRSNIKLLTDMNKTLKFENDELKNQVINANLDSNDFTVKLNNQIAAHQNELSDLNRLFDDERTVLKTQKSEIIQNLNRELNYAKKDLEDSKDKAKILDLEETIRQTNCDFENKYDSIKTNNELLNDFNANLKAENDLLKQRVLNSENDLGANQLTLNKLQLELMQVKNDLEDQKELTKKMDIFESQIRGCPTFMPKPTPSYSFESLTIPNQFCQESINKSTQSAFNDEQNLFHDINAELRKIYFGDPTQLSKYFMILRSHVLNNTMDTGLFVSVNKIHTYKAKIYQEDPIIGQFSGFGKYNGLPVYVGSRGGVYINAKTKQYLSDETINCWIHKDLLRTMRLISGIELQELILRGPNSLPSIPESEEKIQIDDDFKSIDINISKDEVAILESFILIYDYSSQFNSSFSDFLSEKIQEKGFSCWVSCRSNRFKKRFSQKKKSPYWSGTYQYDTERNKRANHFSNELCVKVTFEKKNDHKKANKVNKCSGYKRQRQSEIVMGNGIVSTIIEDTIHNQENQAFLDQKITSRFTLGMMKSALKHFYKISNEAFVDALAAINLTDQIFSESETHLKGYVQEISLSPFGFLMLSQIQERNLSNSYISCERTTKENERDNEFQILLEESEALASGESIEKSSPFKIFFDGLIERYQKSILNDGIVDSSYYCPELFKILENQLYLLPLWTGIMITPNKISHKIKTRLTNNPVENWFGQLKHSMNFIQLTTSEIVAKSYKRLVSNYIKFYCSDYNFESTLFKKKPTEKWSDKNRTKRKRNKKDTFFQSNNFSNLNYNLFGFDSEHFTNAFKMSKESSNPKNDERTSNDDQQSHSDTEKFDSVESKFNLMNVQEFKVFVKIEFERFIEKNCANFNILRYKFNENAINFNLLIDLLRTSTLVLEYKQFYVTAKVMIETRQQELSIRFFRLFPNRSE